MFEKLKNFFNKEKKDNPPYFSCRYLQGGIAFLHHDIKACPFKDGGITFIKDYDGRNIPDWNKIFKQRKKVIEKLKKGSLPENCSGCRELKMKQHEENSLINNIYINHWTHCSSACVYCTEAENGQFFLKYPQAGKYYSVFKPLEELYKSKMISSDVHIKIDGGELTMLDEAGKLLELIITGGAGSIEFYSSCINYSSEIERALREIPEASFVFSIDCGNRELYKKIKRIDAFDEVKCCIKKYAASSEKAANAMTAAFVIIDGFNDSIEAVFEWLNFIYSLGIKNVRLELNYQRYMPVYSRIKRSIPSHYKDLYTFYKKSAAHLGLTDKTKGLSEIFPEQTENNKIDAEEQNCG